jgi:hypothetical protein
VSDDAAAEAKTAPDEVRAARRRALVVLLGMVVLAAVAVGGALFAHRAATSTSAHSRPALRRPKVAFDPARARASATAACQTLQRFEGMMRANARASVVRSEIRLAASQADAAVVADPVWLQLDSAVKELKYAIDNNDGPAARQAVAITRPQCAGLGVDTTSGPDQLPTSETAPSVAGR